MLFCCIIEDDAPPEEANGQHRSPSSEITEGIAPSPLAELSIGLDMGGLASDALYTSPKSNCGHRTSRTHACRGVSD